MLRDVYWRQYPIDLLSDDKMACVEAMLPDDQKHIPYMIYIAALKLCDDNGVFDFDDGVVLARLTRVKDVNVVKDIVNMMRQRKILYRLFDDSTLCGLTDWTYSDKKPRTIEERRKLVAERIQKEQTRAGVDKDFTLPGEQPTPAAAVTQAPEALQPDPSTKEVQTAPQRGVFLCPENDKKAENVVNTEMDDKNAKNVVTLQYSTVQDNNTVHTDSIDIHTNTHTQQLVPSSELPVDSPLEPSQNTNAVGEKIQNENTKNLDTLTQGDANSEEDVSTLAEMALRGSGKISEEKDTGELVTYLQDFFVKKSYGYKPNQSASAIKKLAAEIMQLSDEVNPPVEIAAVLCSEFKKMSEGDRGKHWKDIPLLPARMINPDVWAALMQHAGKILATTKSTDKFMVAAKKAQEECDNEKQLVYDAMREEYLKYNIDPDDPDAYKLLIIAKSREQEEIRKAKEVEEEAKALAESETSEQGFDIF